MLMLMGVWPRIDMLFLGTHLLFMEELFLGVLNIRTSSCCRQLSEYVVVTHAAKEALWLRSLIQQLFGTTLSPTTLYSNNQSALVLSKDHQYHARTKHINIRFHFIRWIIERGSIRLIYCPTEDMIADTLMKALPSAKVKHFASELGLSTA